MDIVSYPMIKIQCSECKRKSEIICMNIDKIYGIETELVDKLKQQCKCRYIWNNIEENLCKSK